MTLPTLPVPAIATDPGILLWASLGSTEPTHTVTNGVFSDEWPAAWLVLGATDEGSEFNFQTSTDTITAAEFLDPLKYVSTGREGGIAFALMSITATNLKRALNGGTLTTTGTGATTMTTYTPPAVGEETRCMIGWESQDSTERLIAYQCFNTGQVKIARKKGADKATIPVEYALEAPLSGLPFKYLTAGSARA